MIMQKFAFCLSTHIIPQIFSGKKVYILALLFARRKKYRKYLRYILQNAKINEKNCGIFCRAQKILQKLAQKQTKKIYDNRKYLRYILRIAKISVNISDIFCKSQKIPLKIPQKKPKKTYGSYMICFLQGWDGSHITDLI